MKLDRKTAELIADEAVRIWKENTTLDMVQAISKAKEVILNGKISPQ